MSGFSSLAAMRKSRGSIADLQQAVEKLNQSNYEKDDRYWNLTVDKAGVGAAVIRFLPAPQDEDLPWVRYWNHAFEGPTGKWYIENSLSTLGQNDPVGELNTELWNSGEAGKEIARKQKRKLHYVSNILVISDPKAPENEGKVFLFRYGVKIFDKIKDAMNPPEGLDQEKINPYDFWSGANFKLRRQNVDRFPNYDKSSFAEPSELEDGDEKSLEKIWKQEYSLAAEIAPDKFKTYDELKKKLDFVLKGGPASSRAKSEDGEDSPFQKSTRQAKPADDGDVQDEVEEPTKLPPRSSKKKEPAAVVVEEDDEEEEQPTPVKGGKKAAPAKKKAEVKEDDDDSLSYFAKLAEED